MKSPRFEYHAPSSAEQARALLGHYRGEARVLAGGQSLVPLLHRRALHPAALIDINRIGALDRLGVDDDGALVIGATARQSAVECFARVRDKWPVVAEALRNVAHPAVRNRGTVVGSICHADPAAELPSLAIALDARITVAAGAGDRELSVADLFDGRWQTRLDPDELATSLRIPAPAPRSGAAWLELARRRGDLPVAGVAAAVTIAADGVCERVRLVCANVADTPFDARDAALLLVGKTIDEAAARSAGDLVGRDCEPRDDYQGTAAQRRHVVAVLVRRALLLADARARAGSRL